MQLANAEMPRCITRLKRAVWLVVLVLSACQGHSADPVLPALYNRPPVIQFLTVNPETVAAGAWLLLQCSAADVESGALVYSWTGAGEFESPTAPQTRWRNNLAGEVSITCTVRDEGGLTASISVTVHVTATPPQDLAPVITALTSSQEIVPAGTLVVLTCIASDPEDAQISYAWTGPGTFTAPGLPETEWTNDAPGLYELTCLVTDPAGNRASATTQLTVTEAENSFPQITDIGAIPATFDYRDFTLLECSAVDADGDPITYAWQGPGSFSDSKSAQTEWRINLPGEYQLSCTVSDPHGTGDTQQLTVNVVVDNAQVTIHSISADPPQVAPGEETLLSVEATASNQQSLAYEWSGEGEFTDPSSSQCIWRHDQSGTYELQCTVTPARGDSASASVQVTVQEPGDTAPPLWDGGSSGLSVVPFEGYVHCAFNQAHDVESAPVSYELYYAEYIAGEELDIATASKLKFDSFPAMPVKVEGLTLGTTYTFAVRAGDSAPEVNWTPFVTATATPQVYFDVIPGGDIAFSDLVVSSCIASRSTAQPILCVVWVDPISGHLYEAHAADGSWMVRQAQVLGTPQRFYVLVRVVFFSGRPVVVASDNAGHLDILRQRLDAKWDAIQVFSDPEGGRHCWLDAALDPEQPMLYIGHVTEQLASPHTQYLNFLELNLISGGNPVAASIAGHDQAGYLGQLRVRISPSGDPALAYIRGQYSLTNPAAVATEMVIATYKAFEETLDNETVPLAGMPLFMDIQPAVDHWDVLTAEINQLDLLGTQYLGTRLLLYNNLGGIWLPTQIDTSSAVEIAPDQRRYNLMLETSLLPGSETLYYTKGNTVVTPPAASATCDLSLWSGPLGVHEPGTALAQISPLTISNARYVLGIETPAVNFTAYLNPTTFPSGPLVFRQME